MKASRLFTLILAITFLCSFCMVLSTSAAEKAVKSPAAEKAVKSPAAEKPALSGKININAATVEQLEMLPRIGTKTAQSIIEYRTQSGPFKKVEDLTNVKGIGEKTLEQLKSFIILEGNTTLKRE